MIDDPSLHPTLAADRERLPVMLAYGLYLLAIANGVTLLIGFIIALVRRDEARGTLYESHYRNLITVFFAVMAFAGLMLAAAAAGFLGVISLAFSRHALWDFYTWVPLPAILIPAAMMGSFLLGLWYLWRVVGGFIRALDEKPY